MVSYFERKIPPLDFQGVGFIVLGIQQVTIQNIFAHNILRFYQLLILIHRNSPVSFLKGLISIAHLHNFTVRLYDCPLQFILRSLDLFQLFNNCIQLYNYNVLPKF